MKGETKMGMPVGRAALATRRQVISGGAVTLGMIVFGTGAVLAADEEGILRAEEAIHQEPVFRASRKRVYEALTETNQFAKAVELSAAMSY